MACRRRTPPISAKRRAGCICRSAILSDDDLALTRALKLPTFTAAGMTLLKRMALVIDDGVDHQGVLSGVSAGQERRGSSWLRLILRVPGVEISAGRCGEHRAEHLRRQHAGVGVVARAVIAAKTASASPMRVCCRRARTARRDCLRAERRRPRCRARCGRARRWRAGSASRRWSGSRKSRQVLISAGVGLFSGGTQRTALVMRQSTSSSPSSGARVVVAAREAVTRQRLVEQVAGIVAGERPPGAVGAAQAGREADDQQARVERPERGHRRIEPGRLAARASPRGRRPAADSAGSRARACRSAVEQSRG